MNDRVKAFLAASKRLRGEADLSVEEKTRVKQDLAMFMDQLPVAPTVSAVPMENRVNRVRLLWWRMPRFALVLFLVVLLVGGSVGTSFAAEHSLPGDALYPVKIYVGEGVRSFLARSPAAQGKWNQTLVERRLAEADTLTQRAPLAPDVARAMQKQIQNYTERLNQSLRTLAANGQTPQALEIASVVEELFKIHEENRTSSTLKELITASDEAVAHLREDLEATLQNEKGELVKKAAEAKALLAQERMEVLNGIIANGVVFEPVFTAHELSSYPKVANDWLVQGQEQFKAGYYGEAFVYYQRSLTVTEKGIVLAQKIMQHVIRE